jgi:hypothetical protein
MEEAHLEPHVCGSLLSILTSKNPELEFQNFFYDGEKQHKNFTLSNESAVFKYILCNINSKIYCAVDFTSRREDFLTVKSPVDLFSSKLPSAEQVKVPGQILKLAELFPFISVINIASSSNVHDIILCGEGLSGTVSHAIAMMLNEHLKTAAAIASTGDAQIVARSVSFSGPLCVSPPLVTPLTSSDGVCRHTTLCVSDSILDRVLFDFQRLSPLITLGEVEEWRSIYETVYSCMSEYVSAGHLTDIQRWLERLQVAESNLSKFERERTVNTLIPVGVFISVTSPPFPESITFVDSHAITAKLVSLNCQYTQSWRDVYNMEKQDSKEPRDHFFSDVNFRGFTVPQATHISMRSFGRYGLTIRIEGNNLDTVLRRNISHPISFFKADMLKDFPFSISPEDAYVLTDAHLLAVRSSYEEVIIDITGIQFTASSIMLSLNTDFGSSKPIRFSTSKLTVSQEAPTQEAAQALHPAMNSEFLGVALLRVALCSMHCGGIVPMSEQYPFITTIWVKLIDLERLCNFREAVLERQMDLFLNKTIAISKLRADCDKRLMEISEHATESFQLEESVVKKGTRKTLGKHIYSLFL